MQFPCPVKEFPVRTALFPFPVDLAQAFAGNCAVVPADFLSGAAPRLSRFRAALRGTKRLQLQPRLCLIAR